MTTVNREGDTMAVKIMKCGNFKITRQSNGWYKTEYYNNDNRKFLFMYTTLYKTLTYIRASAESFDEAKKVIGKIKTRFPEDHDKICEWETDYKHLW